MTSPQRAALDYIKAFWKEKGYGPSYREIGKAMGLASVSTIYRTVSMLARDGHVRLGGTRNIVPVEHEGCCPFCGAVRAA